MWEEIIKLSGVALAAIVEYAAASAEKKAALRAQAEADALRAYDLIDDHLLKQDKIVDDLADQKFGPRPTHL